MVKDCEMPIVLFLCFECFVPVHSFLYSLSLKEDALSLYGENLEMSFFIRMNGPKNLHLRITARNNFEIRQATTQYLSQ